MTVNAPTGQMVVGNMPAKDVKDLGNGLTRTTFATSPKMSTYLLFLGVGDFDRATLNTDDGVEVGVIAQKGKAEQARFALEASRDVLREYNEYFGVKYPLPKLDNIAAPAAASSSVQWKTGARFLPSNMRCCWILPRPALVINSLSLPLRRMKSRISGLAIWSPCDGGMICG